MINFGINGFGRIGRALTRLILQSKDCKLVVINELDPDIKNLAYLLKYDSIYGQFPKKVTADLKNKAIICGNSNIRVYSFPKTESVPWHDHNVDVVIDATGVKENVLASRSLIKRGVPKVIITHSPPDKDVDITIIMGVNDSKYNPKSHHVISSSICDASAIAPVLFELNKKWGIENCFITTLHPWISYQNLLDGPLSSVSSPGHFWKEYSLGRNSTMSLIPKDTTAATAVLKVLPELKNKLDAISFRIPTNIVSASDITILLKKKADSDDINSHIEKISKKTNNNVFELEREHLVSIDYLGTNKSVIVDASRTKVIGNKMVKMVLWYDNEWGYSNKVIDIAKLVTKKLNHKLKKEEAVLCQKAS